MEEEKVSIVVPIYNVGKYIEKFAESLFKQTYKNLEFVFVDDNSPDDSIKLLKSVLERYPNRIDQVQFLRHKQNKGLPAARNTGLSVITGDYVYHCDSDDWLDLHLVSAMMEVLLKNDADLVFSDFYTLYPDEKVKTNLSARASFFEYLEGFCRGGFPGNVFNKIVKRSLYFENDVWFPEGFSMLEDLRTMIPLFYYADTIVYCNKPLYFYRRDIANSLSGSNYSQNPILSQSRVRNVIGIESFLKSKDISGVDGEVMRLKLGAKQNLLVHGRKVIDYKTWKNTFPECNNYVWKTNLPVYYKIIAWCSDKKLWLIIQAWIFIKYHLIKGKFLKRDS